MRLLFLKKTDLVSYLITLAIFIQETKRPQEIVSDTITGLCFSQIYERAYDGVQLSRKASVLSSFLLYLTLYHR